MWKEAGLGVFMEFLIRRKVFLDPEILLLPFWLKFLFFLSKKLEQVLDKLEHT